MRRCVQKWYKSIKKTSKYRQGKDIAAEEKKMNQAIKTKRDSRLFLSSLLEKRGKKNPYSHSAMQWERKLVPSGFLLVGWLGFFGGSLDAGAFLVQPEAFGGECWDFLLLVFPTVGHVFDCREMHCFSAKRFVSATHHPHLLLPFSHCQTTANSR